MNDPDLKSLIEENKKLREVLICLMRRFPVDSDLIAANWEEFDIDQAMRAYDAARAAIADSSRCNTVLTEVCKTCGGSRVDPGGLPACRDCTLIPRADEPVCKGSYVWGNGCGKCSACLAEIKHHVVSDAPMASEKDQGGIDYLGLSLDLESSSYKVESKTAARAMEAAAWALRLTLKSKREVVPHGWLYDWTHSSALGKTDQHYTSFTTDQAYARKHDNVRAVYLAAPTPPTTAAK